MLYEQLFIGFCSHNAFANLSKARVGEIVIKWTDQACVTKCTLSSNLLTNMSLCHTCQCIEPSELATIITPDMPLASFFNTVLGTARIEII